MSADLDFAGRLAALGWISDRPEVLYPDEREAAEAMLADGRVAREVRDGRPVVVLTEAGHAWLADRAGA